MSELDETTALSSRNFHINQLSKLPKHIPQVLVTYSWVQTSNKYLPTQSLPSACHQQIRSFLQIVHSYVWLLLVKGLTTNCTYRTPMTKPDSLRHHKLANLPAFPQPCQHLKSPCHRSNNAAKRPPNLPTKTQSLQTNAFVNSQLCCLGRCLWEMTAEMARELRTPCRWRRLREKLHPLKSRTTSSQSEIGPHRIFASQHTCTTNAFHPSVAKQRPDIMSRPRNPSPLTPHCNPQMPHLTFVYATFP